MVRLIDTINVNTSQQLYFNESEMKQKIDRRTQSENKYPTAYGMVLSQFGPFIAFIGILIMHFDFNARSMVLLGGR